MVTPSRIIAPAALAALLAASTTASAPVAAARQQHTATVNDMETYYETAGSGEPLLLLHSGTQTGRMFDPFVAELSAHYRLIIPDLRGHGGSTNPQGLWTTRQFAADVFALLDELGLPRVRAIGASAGAMTLLHMATTQPQRIESMVVIGVGTYLPSECRAILAATDADALPESAWQRLREKHRHGDDQIRALYEWVASLVDSYGDMTFTPPQLATITAPTLVMHGDRDYCFPASMAWEIYRAIPEAFLWVVPNGGHVPITGPHAAEFAATAKEFLAGNWAKAQR